jgi:MFS family permease
MSLIPKWFVRKRGLASGLVLSGIGMGTMALAPLCESVIQSVGWRVAFLVLAALILFLVLPITALFHRGSPAEVGQCPEDFEGPAAHQVGCSAKGPAYYAEPTRHWALKEALRTGAFWHTAFVVFCNGVFINMLLVHQVAYLVDAGFSEMRAASALGGILILVSLRDNTCPWMLYAFVILYGLGYGSILPVTAGTTGDLFPGNALGRILAVQSVGFGLGGALGPYLAGYIYDLTGTYLLPMSISMLSIVLGIYGIWMAAPRRARVH